MRHVHNTVLTARSVCPFRYRQWLNNNNKVIEYVMINNKNCWKVTEIPQNVIKLHLKRTTKNVLFKYWIKILARHIT